MLRGLVDVGKFTEAINFYHLMIEQGLTPDNYAYPIVLKACYCLHALEEGRRVQEMILYNEVHDNITPNVYVLCAMIDMFAKCGSLRDAQRLFERMPIRDLVSWTAMIRGTLWNGEWLQALSLFRRMRSEGLYPDSVIVATLLPVCGRLEALQLGMALQGCAMRSGFESDLYASNALIDMYFKCGDPRHAHQIFCHMVYRDPVSWTTLISGYSQNNLYQESLEVHLKMINMGFKTNAFVLTSVVPAWVRQSRAYVI
ncbi:hypothetical protein L6164_034867 [Bauhinia variegata]|uniref:Uncharacterized protein n=1 Tax=Bauhinia variegata TaxID=167791 RepID=A0ACB9KWR7_BAUVA|nr:hypothetical protein L6164_034867 [Bauhinia variegata]